MKNNKGNKMIRKVDGRDAPIHSITVKNTEKSNSNEPDEVTFSVFKSGKRRYKVKFSAPIMGLTEWLKPFADKDSAISFAEEMAEAT
jgi:hypothetical protein